MFAKAKGRNTFLFQCFSSVACRDTRDARVGQRRFHGFLYSFTMVRGTLLTCVGTCVHNYFLCVRSLSEIDYESCATSLEPQRKNGNMLHKIMPKL